MGFYFYRVCGVTASWEPYQLENDFTCTSSINLLPFQPVVSDVLSSFNPPHPPAGMLRTLFDGNCEADSVGVSGSH